MGYRLLPETPMEPRKGGDTPPSSGRLGRSETGETGETAPRQAASDAGSVSRPSRRRTRPPERPCKSGLALDLCSEPCLAALGVCLWHDSCMSQSSLGLNPRPAGLALARFLHQSAAKT